MGRASDVHAGDVLPRPGAGGGARRSRSWQNVEPFKTVLSGDREAMAKLTDAGPREDPRRDAHRHDGGGVQRRGEEVARRRPRTRAGSGPTPSSSTSRCSRCCSTCAPTATRPTSSPAAARTSCASTPSRSTASRPSRWSAPPGETKYGYDKDGKPILTKEPKLLLNDDNAGKPEGIHLMIGRRPVRGVRQLDRRPADAGVHRGRRRRAAGDAGAARRCGARIRLRPGRRGCPTPRSAPSPQALYDEAKKQRLDRDQHEERLEAHLRVRAAER